ncbi:hypothetical protein [Micrococcoides hystricis]|uniref:Uncharacterized protein n=1 Tax=Micrococcoides hystricis TaxID=1572761 RepID=A0ABV6P966_9MICC
MTEQQPPVIDGERQLNMSAGKKRFITLFYGIVSTLAGIAFFPFVTETMEPTGWGYTGAWQATTAFSFGTVTGLVATAVVIAVASWLFSRMVFTKWHLDYTYLMGTAGAFLAAILHTAAFITITTIGAMTGTPIWSFTLFLESALHVLLSGFIAGVFTTEMVQVFFRLSRWENLGYAEEIRSGS